MLMEDSNVLRMKPASERKMTPLRATLYMSLECAKHALAARTMTEADARAWLDLDDLQESLLRGHHAFSRL